MKNWAKSMELKKKKFVCLIIAIPVLVIILSQRFWNNPFFDFNDVWRSVSEHDFPRSENKHLHGLLPPNLDQESCISRYNINSYRKPSPFIPSSSLISSLRIYENLHKQCGPSSSSFQNSIKTHKNSTSNNCKYLIIKTRDGLGNRILAIVSAFFYALLSQRILLIDPQNGILNDIFCEPFENSTWFLPQNFPINQNFESFGNLVRNMKLKSMAESSSLYLHLSHDATDYDKLFFCDKHQAFLKNIPWLIMETNNYLIPALFLTKTFREKTAEIFPEKETVFHHLSRYLLHPSNNVWGLIKRSYEPYLSRSTQIIGLQIRVFGSESGSFEDQMKQILACTQQNNLIPELQKPEKQTDSKTQKVKAILVTSLNSEYLERLKAMFLENPTVSGEMVKVYQPSYERVQSTGEKLHDEKAMAEIFLLSLSDVLVTSSWSTFGYVAQGLGGLRPWILYKDEERVFGAMKPWLRFRGENQSGGAWPCTRGASVEPCYHTPPVCDCEEMRMRDGGEVVRFVRHCEDVSWGIKLVDH